MSGSGSDSDCDSGNGSSSGRIIKEKDKSGAHQAGEKMAVTVQVFNNQIYCTLKF